MYKLLIVDDEEEVRHGIVKKIDWSQFNFVVIGEAENGREALDIIEDNIPDIIITDISMPLMNGLELAKSVKQSFPTVKIVILSGYDDFKFAQQAIKYGVSDYILKPVLPDDLNKLVGKLKNQLDNEIEEKKDRKKLEQHYLDSLPILKDNFLTSLVIGNLEIGEIESKISFFDLTIRGNFFSVAIIGLDKKSIEILENEEKIKDLTKFAVLKIAQDILSNNTTGEAFYYGNALVIIAGMNDNARADACNKLFLVLDEIRQNVEKYLSITITIGIGNIIENIVQMKESYDTANIALEYKLVLGGNKIIFVEDIEPVSNNMICLEEEKEKKLLSSIKFGDNKNVENAVQNLFNDFSGIQAPINEYHLYFMEIFTMLSKLSRIYQLDIMDMLPENYNLYLEINNFNSMDEAENWIMSLSIELMKQIASERLTTTQRLLEKAKDYINSNYNDTELSVQKLADYLFISASYLSLIFKKEAKETFLKYLIRIRLDVAKNLLRNPGMKISEVAGKVGYPDISYFSYFFKKNFGVSPREYKNSEANKLEQKNEK
ncbi:MAG: response regulator [Clostridiales bacterium]|nr:response regulator [Clostridiales bacterium]